ncbi:hypothetical protein [Nocardioides jejuensis]|uniref:Uncharacterized protein n=1 Tax=Nocardioides jejuensis TaxID=2502782 RepID=A0A4R1BW24_9ACTN|nr:hypothetical protein [Nocardioides jejuensis]TCJ22001.1 hypothetical protein EPD65_13965 [Nocardioides jejuensis]
MRRLITIALVAPTLSMGVVLGLSASAQAACASGPLRTELKDASLVVTGTVTTIDELPGRQVYTVAVERVYAGTAHATLEVQAPTADRPCALPVKKGDHWLFLSQGAAKTPVVRADWGSTPLSSEAATVVANVLGSGHRPSAGGSGTTEVRLTKVDASEPWGFWQLALPGAVLAGGGFLVLLLARALGRARH